MKIVVLISGNGSNLQAVLDAIGDGRLCHCEIALVISDRKNAYGLKRAKDANVPTLYLPFKREQESRQCYEANLAREIEKHSPAYIFCLGFLHIFEEPFVRHFQRRLVNLHPALPSTFTGLNCIEKQYKAMMEGGNSNRECGVMCHYVDSGVDTGEVIATKKIECDTSVSFEEFEKRIHQAEHEVVIEVIKAISVT